MRNDNSVAAARDEPELKPKTAKSERFRGCTIPRVKSTIHDVRPLAVVLVLTAVSLLSVAAQTTTAPASTPAVTIPEGFIIGADTSSVQAAEGRGVKYSDKGVQKDILAILKDHGFTYIRLRVFNDPTKPTPRDRPYSVEGYCDLPHTIEMNSNHSSGPVRHFRARQG